MTRSGRYLILTRGGLLGTPGGPGGIMEHIERNHRIKSNGHKKSLTHSADGIMCIFQSMIKMQVENSYCGLIAWMFGGWRCLAKANFGLEWNSKTTICLPTKLWLHKSFP